MTILLGKRLKFSINVSCIQITLQVGQSCFELVNFKKKCYLLKITLFSVTERNSMVVDNNNANTFFVQLDFRDLEVHRHCNLFSIS